MDLLHGCLVQIIQLFSRRRQHHAIGHGDVRQIAADHQGHRHRPDQAQAKRRQRAAEANPFLRRLRLLFQRRQTQADQYQHDPADASDTEARNDKDLEDDQHQPQHKEEQGQHDDPLVPMGPEEEQEADGGDDQRQTDARHLQLEHQADDADHDEQHANERQPNERSDVVQPVRRSLADAAGFDAVVGVQLLEVLHDQLGDLELDGLLGSEPEKFAVLPAFLHQVFDDPLMFLGLVGLHVLLAHQPVFAVAAADAVDLNLAVEHPAG